MRFFYPHPSRPTTLAYRLWWWLFQPYKWLIYGSVLILSTFFLGGVITALISVVARAPFISKLGIPWARFNALVAMMSVSVSGREHIDPEQSYAIVANHQSQFDIFVIYGWLGIDFKWVMKQELRRVPFLGYFCEKAEHIYINRSDPQAALAALEAAKPKIVNGTSILFFPEGTRSKTGQLLRFKKGAFKLAKDLELPILPVTIVGSKDVLPPGTTDLMPGRVKLVIHPPIPTTNYENLTLHQLASMTRDCILSALE